MTAVTHDLHDVHAAPAPPPTGWRRLLAPGWLRVPWMIALFFGIFVPALAFLPLGHETKGLLLGMAVVLLMNPAWAHSVFQRVPKRVASVLLTPSNHG